MNRQGRNGLHWQSKTILLLVIPWTAAHVLLQAHWWATQVPVVTWTALGICGIFGLVVWRLRAGTLGAAATGAAITASLMFATTRYPYPSGWLHGALMPLLVVFVLTFAATKLGKTKKERLGTGESGRGRNAAQVAANLGTAALLASTLPGVGALLAYAVLAEAAADTVSSEIGQVFGGQPRMLGTFHRVEPGTDGGVTILGTVAGLMAAAIVAGIASWTVTFRWFDFLIVVSGAVFGLLFDSLLGATIERRGGLNNDAVNFLSTLSAAAFSFAVLKLLTGLMAF